MIIIDIGACIGEFIDFAIKKWNPGKLYAFEPFPNNFTFLKQKYRDQQQQIEIIEAAVSSFKGEAQFYKKEYSQGRGYDFAGNAGSSLYRLKNKPKPTIMVNVIRLSDFIRDKGISMVDILKVDAEGSEYDIFDELMTYGGMEKIGKIYFEDHCRKLNQNKPKKERVVERMKEEGFFDKLHSEIWDYPEITGFINE